MTSNQINYQKNLETERSNRVQERLAREELALKRETLDETKRSNLAKEVETNRSNLAKETETNRANLAAEELKTLSNLITASHYYYSDTETVRTNKEKEQETHRSNVAKESHAQNQLSADIEKHVADKIASVNKLAGAGYILGAHEVKSNISQLGYNIANMFNINNNSGNYVYDYNNSESTLPHYGSE